MTTQKSNNMNKKKHDPYKDVKLNQTERFIEFIGVAFAAGMILFFFLKTLFF